MEFPIFQVPYIGHGMTIGTNAILHVLLSHGFAIGVVTMLGIAELIGYLYRSEEWENFAHWAATPVVVILSSVSAITGVGIWFTIGPLAPRASSSMLRIFFWPWFIEWLDFMIEWAILLPWYFRWKQWMTPPRMKKLHISLPFLYLVGSLGSAWLITGIIGFMLTPGDWPYQGGFWQAFNNPSLWQQTFLRIFGGLALGVIITVGLLFVWKRLPELRRSALRVYGLLLVLFGGLTAISTYLWLLYVPPTFRTHGFFALFTSHIENRSTVFYALLWTAIGLIALFALVSILGVRFLAKILVVPALAAAIMLVVGFERFREFVRGPYVMMSYMYASEVLAKETPYLRQHGALSRLYWYNTIEAPPTLEQVGQALFGENCVTCHTIGGINNIQSRVRGRTRDGIAVILGHTHQLVPWMPPFSGTEEEKQALAAYFYALAQQGRAHDVTYLPSPPGAQSD